MDNVANLELGSYVSLPHFTFPSPLLFLLVLCFLFFGFAGNAQVLFLAQFAASGVKLYFALASAPEVRAPLPASCCGTSAQLHINCN